MKSLKFKSNYAIHEIMKWLQIVKTKQTIAKSLKSNNVILKKLNLIKCFKVFEVPPDGCESLRSKQMLQNFEIHTTCCQIFKINGMFANH